MIKAISNLEKELSNSNLHPAQVKVTKTFLGKCHGLTLAKQRVLTKIIFLLSSATAGQRREGKKLRTKRKHSKGKRGSNLKCIKKKIMNIIKGG